MRSSRRRAAASATTADAGLAREGAHRVPGGHMYPRPAEIDRRASQVHCVQPAADPIPGLQHNALGPGVREGVRDRQTRDPRADHHHALDRSRHPAGNIRPPVIEALSSQCHHPAQANDQRSPCPGTVDLAAHARYQCPHRMS